MLGDLDRLAEVCDPGTKVIVIGHVNDVMLYRELVAPGRQRICRRAGQGDADHREHLGDLHRPGDRARWARSSPLSAPKAAPARALSATTPPLPSPRRVKSDVVIADLDLPFGTAGLDFNQDPLQGIADALASPERLDEMLLDRLLSRCSDHLSLFAAPGTLDRPYDLEPQACDTVLDVVRENVPWIAVDVPHLWTAWAKQVVLRADHVVITAMPDLANLRNAKNLVDQMKATRPNDRHADAGDEPGRRARSVRRSR